MAWQMPLWDALPLSKFKVAVEVLPIARGIQQEASTVASNKRVHLLASEHQPVGIRGLGDARLNVCLRKLILAHLRTTQAKEIVCSCRNATTTIEIIADAF